MSAQLGAPTLPIIDVFPWADGDPWRTRVADQMDWAASEFGFFYIVGHGIDRTCVDRLDALSRTFFAQDEATKQQIGMSRGRRA